MPPSSLLPQAPGSDPGAIDEGTFLSEAQEFFSTEKKTCVKLWSHGTTCFNMVLSGFFLCDCVVKFVCCKKCSSHWPARTHNKNNYTMQRDSRYQDTSFSMRWVHWMLKPEICCSNVSICTSASSTSIWDCSPNKFLCSDLEVLGGKPMSHAMATEQNGTLRLQQDNSTPPLRAKIAAEDLHICAWLFHVTPCHCEKNTWTNPVNQAYEWIYDDLKKSHQKAMRPNTTWN